MESESNGQQWPFADSPITSMPASYRIYSEGVSCNNKIYSESETSARVLQNVQYLRDHTKVFYDCVPEERVEEFAKTRQQDENRQQKKINQRFPELNAAREAFLGKQQAVASGRKRNDVQGVVKFSEVVEKLAKEEEPYESRYGRSVDARRMTDIKELDVPTLTHVLKHKYILRSRHRMLSNDRFIPNNRFEAASQVLRHAKHDDAPFKPRVKDDNQEKIARLHGDSVFRRSSPVS